jgi:hypothetical protein
MTTGLAYPLLQYAHILLLVYWLGTDLGVYWCAKYVGRSDLPLAERQRFLQLLLKLDMGPRTALVLMVPTGTLMVFIAQWLPLRGAAAAAVCALALAWLALVWRLYLRPASPAVLRDIDRTTRWLVVAAMAALGLLLVSGAGAVLGLEGPRWLGGKFLAYGGAVLCGLRLRGVLTHWAQGFGELRDATTAAQGEARIAAAMPAAFGYAYALWGCVLVAALLGVVKP